ncbi:MAG: polysaccharide export protein [Magnetospirillum sp.]|nr:polysaccharide export protein [Magnetospirillum sp.]
MKGTTISALDNLDIKFLLHPEFNETVLVPLDGYITLALADRIEAANRTPRQLAESIKGAYRGVMRDPVVSVQVRQFSGLRTFVGGEVLQPGSHPMTSQLSVAQAIMAAGGFKPSARTNEVVVIRQKDDGSRMVFAVDIDKVISGEDTTNDVPLQPLDLVFVPRSDAANVAFAMEQYFRNVLPLSTTGGVSASYYINSQPN